MWIALRSIEHQACSIEHIAWSMLNIASSIKQLASSISHVASSSQYLAASHYYHHCVVNGHTLWQWYRTWDHARGTFHAAATIPWSPGNGFDFPPHSRECYTGAQSGGTCACNICLLGRGSGMHRHFFCGRGVDGGAQRGGRVLSPMLAWHPPTQLQLST